MHDSFAKEIFVYTEDKMPAASNESEFNPIFEESTITTAEVILVKTSIMARVKYEDKQIEDNFAGSSSNVPISRGKVRIKIHKDDWALVKNSARIEIDDDLFILDTDPKNAGPFVSNYKLVYLKRE